MQCFVEQDALILMDYFDNSSLSLNIVHCSLKLNVVLSTDIVRDLEYSRLCTLEIGQRLENGHELFLGFALNGSAHTEIYIR